MCNEWAQERAWTAYCELMEREALGIINNQIDLPFGSIHPSENAGIIRAAPGGTSLDRMPWGWVPQGRKGLIINVRAEGRRDPPSARGLAVFDRFYEFRDDAKPKSKFEFTPAVNEPLGFGVLVREGRFALATCEPGPDVRDIHKRQPVIVPVSGWRHWLTDPEWPAELTQPSPAGTLKVLQVR